LDKNAFQPENGPSHDGCGLIITLRCNSRCGHCSYCGGGPAHTSDMTREVMEQAARWLKGCRFASREIHIAGGEPMLVPDKVLEMAGILAAQDLPVSFIESNGYWGSQPEVFGPVLERLKVLGLKRFVLSCSPFHLEAVSHPVLKQAMALTVEILGPQGCTVFDSAFEPLVKELFNTFPENLTLNGFLRACGSGIEPYLRQQYALHTGGRVGYGFLSNILERRPAREFDQPCQEIIVPPSHCHLDPLGNYIPDVCMGLTLGNICQLDDLLDLTRLNKRPVFRILAEEGPFGLARWAKDTVGYSFEKQSYVGRCHLCTDVRRYLWKLGQNREELQPDVFYMELELSAPDSKTKEKHEI
jgi:hypothetical protein